MVDHDAAGAGCRAIGDCRLGWFVLVLRWWGRWSFILGRLLRGSDGLLLVYGAI